MQKPNYFEMRIPAAQKDFSSAAQKVFNSFEGEIVDIDFSVERRRKTFKYQILSSKSETWYGAMDNKKSSSFLLKLKLNK